MGFYFYILICEQSFMILCLLFLRLCIGSSRPPMDLEARNFNNLPLFKKAIFVHQKYSHLSKTRHTNFSLLKIRYNFFYKQKKRFSILFIHKKYIFIQGEKNHVFFHEVKNEEKFLPSLSVFSFAHDIFSYIPSATVFFILSLQLFKPVNKPFDFSTVVLPEKKWKE